MTPHLLAINLYGYAAGGETSPGFFYKKLDSSSYYYYYYHLRLILPQLMKLRVTAPTVYYAVNHNLTQFIGTLTKQHTNCYKLTVLLLELIIESKSLNS